MAGPPAPPLLGQPADLGRIVREHGIGRVIVAFPAGPDGELVPLLRAARGLPADVCVVPRLHEVGQAVPRACLDEVWGIPLIPLRRPGRAGLAAKRLFDVLVSALLLALLGIPLLALAVAVRWQLRRPALFRQVRVTGPGQLAEIVKLRTLTGHSDPDTCWVVPQERTTRLGRLLRESHADELPQLLNVLRGQMSLVGPRPERPYFARRFGEQIPGYDDRHRMRCGLTGWAQVHGLNGDTSIADRAAFDNTYIENWSFWLDLSILARTAGMSAAAATGHRGGQP
jgi:lipopolysaccharide/colanic/teichoic acid biosynthesis glycosyltransferase